MKNLVSTSNQETMTSLDLREIVNAARSEHGENPVRNNDFLEKVKDELDLDEATYEKTVGQKLNSRGTMSDYLNLTLDQCMLVGMRESKAVRRSVLVKLKDKEQQQPVNPQIPDFSDPIAAARAWADAKEAEQLAIASRAEIGSRREATAMNTASQATKRANRLETELDKSKEYCSVKRMQMIHHGQKFNWRELKAASAEMEIPPVKVFDQNYGQVNAYHVEVWRAAYAIDMDS